MKKTNNPRYIRRRRTACIAACVLALVFIAIVVAIIVGVSKKNTKSTVSSVATATPANVLPTIAPTDALDVEVSPSAEPSPTASSEAGTQMFVTGDSVNVRKTASSSGEILTKLTKNTSVTAYGTEGDFIKIKIPSGDIGYMSKNYLSTSQSTATEAPAATPNTSKSTTMYVTKDDVNVRDKASSSGTRLTRLSSGTKVTAYSESNGWTYIQYSSGKYGYISSTYLTAKTATATAAAAATPTPTPAHADASEFTTMLGTEDAGKLGKVAEKYLNITKSGQGKITALTNITGFTKVYPIQTVSGGTYYIGIKSDDAVLIADSIADLK